MTALGNSLAPDAPGCSNRPMAIGVLDPLRRRLRWRCSVPPHLSLVRPLAALPRTPTRPMSTTPMSGPSSTQRRSSSLPSAFCGTAWARSKTGARHRNGQALGNRRCRLQRRSSCVLRPRLLLQFLWMPERSGSRAVRLANGAAALTLASSPSCSLDATDAMCGLEWTHAGRAALAGRDLPPRASFNDLYYTSWFEATSLDAELSAIASALHMVASALLSAFRCSSPGPASRLVGAGSAIWPSVSLRIINGMALQNIYPGLYTITAAGFLLIACILLASALLLVRFLSRHSRHRNMRLLDRWVLSSPSGPFDVDPTGHDRCSRTPARVSARRVALGSRPGHTFI